MTLKSWRIAGTCLFFAGMKMVQWILSLLKTNRISSSLLIKSVTYLAPINWKEKSPFPDGLALLSSCLIYNK